MSNQIPSRKNKFSTLEDLIEGLDQRGLLVLQVLLGQQAMKILSEKHTEKVIPKVLIPKDA